MLSNCCDFVMVLVIFMFMQDAAGFFVKHVNTGKCISTTNEVMDQGDWGTYNFSELSNNCLDPAAQFRFRNNSAMLNLKRLGCFEVRSRFDTRIFAIFADPYRPLNTGLGCRDLLDEHRYRAITQTSGGALSVRYGRGKQCAIPGTDGKFNHRGIDCYIGGTTPCDRSLDERFHFGSLTCYGSKIENVNCPKDQYMVVKTASYRGLLDTNTCGSSDDYTCHVNVTCRVKELCDGQHECNNITVDDNLFPSDFCQGMKRYLYFEYQCIDTPKPHLCVKDVRLLHSSLPYKGFVQIETTYYGTKSVCWQSLDNNAENTVCRQLGYGHTLSLVEKTAPHDAKDAIFSGSINCTSKDQALSQCSVTDSQRTCSTFSYISCFICNNPLLKEKQSIPDAQFTASTSSQGHSASDARISSGSSWCAPASDNKHYLQVDLGRLYSLDVIAIFGDGTSAKRVTSYSLNYTTDLMKWNQVQINGQTTFGGPKNDFSYAARQNISVITRALRFAPIAFEVQRCMRIEICGITLLPDKPRNLTVTNIKSRSAEISWLSPENEGDKPVDQFHIKLMKNSALIQNNTLRKVNKQAINNLTAFTTYEVSVAAGNAHGFGEENVASFTSSEEAPSAPPRNIKTASRSTSSLSLIWDAPEKSQQNGVIIDYTVCVSHSENETCFKTYSTREKEFIIRNLNASTQYYVRVLANNKAGSSPYSKSERFFTNGKAVEKATTATSATLTFLLEIPPKSFVYFYVVALKVKDGKEPQSTDIYENNELVTYAKAEQSNNPQPYIATIITSSGVIEDKFILGDGRNTSNPTTRRRRSTTNDYFNGPLEPGTSYRIFQRIFVNEKGDYYSTEWSAVSKTSAYTGLRILSNMSSGDIKAKEGDLVNLLCSAQGEPPITFTWEKEHTKIESFSETQKPHRSSLLVLTVKEQTSFGNYICRIQDRFDSTTHTMRILKDTGAEENSDGSKKYLVGIIVLAILLVISLVAFAYFIYQNRFKSSSAEQNLENKTKDRNISKDIYENPHKDSEKNYEKIEDEQSTYTALKRTGKDEQDDHSYSHLNVAQSEYVNQQETGI